MAARSETKIPWLPLVILFLGIIIFWVVPLLQPESHLTVVPATGSNK